jgi:GH24 family phage-related lysozyme (muramidase)
MWAFYASLFCLLLPEVIFWGFEIDTNPRIWWTLGIIFLIYGIAGRLWDQSIDSTKTSLPWPITILAFALIAASPLHPDTAHAMSQIQTTSQVEIDLGGPTPATSSSYDDAFLDVAIPFIGRWEGLRLAAYLDIVGVPTVCYGETKGVSLGDSYTKAQCDAMFAHEVIDYRDGLQPAFTRDTIAARLTIHRHVAYVSLAYNVGVHGTSKSTAVRRLNRGDVAGACEALGWWNKAGGRVVRGLVNRRSEETELCMRGLA